MSLRPLRFVPSTWLSAPISWLLAAPAFAQLVFNSGAPNTLNSPTGDPPIRVEVRDSAGGDPTSLEVVAGAVIGGGSGQSVGVFGNSVYTMSGGAASGDLFVTDNARATLSGGTFGDDAVAEGSGRITILPGGGIGDDFTVRGSGHLEMSGGTLPDEVFVQGSATAAFTGGVIGDDLNPLENSVITIHDVTLEDSIDALGSSVTNVMGGTVEGSANAGDSSKINIAGGYFPNVFSGGAGISASGPGAMVVINGGNFGTAGENDGGGVTATLGGMASFSNATVAGLMDGNAPTATFAAVLNGQLHLSNAHFSDLALEAGNGGQLYADDFTAESVLVQTLGGGAVNIDGGQADTLEVFAELESTVNLRGGNFAEIDVELVTNSVLTIFGNSFTYLGTPVESLPPGGYIAETGELRTIGGLLAGKLADGTPFSLTFSRQFFPLPGARVFFVNIPEPGTLVLMISGCLGMVTCWSRGRRQN